MNVVRISKYHRSVSKCTVSPFFTVPLLRVGHFQQPTVCPFKTFLSIESHTHTHTDIHTCTYNVPTLPM